MMLLKRIRQDKSVTLVELLLALTLGAVLLAPVTLALQVGLKTWKETKESDELVQQMRIAMSRITMELKYATELIQADTTLEFDTVYLLDGTPDTERIRYRQSGNYLYRSQESGPEFAIAGANESYTKIPVDVISFTVVPLKSDGSSLGGMTIPPELLSDADAVQIFLTMADKDGDQLSLTNLVLLRNQ